MSIDTGRRAENEAATFLQQKGYKILSKNWRTRVCEIDIVATKDKIVYFVEVKYRSHESQGSGLEYITKTKLRQMTFAAEVWIAEHDWTNDYRLMAVEVSGKDFMITNFVEVL